MGKSSGVTQAVFKALSTKEVNPWHCVTCAVNLKRQSSGEAQVSLSSNISTQLAERNPKLEVMLAKKGRNLNR